MLDNVLVCNSSRQKQLWLLYPWFSTGEIPQPSRLPLNLCLSPESVEQQFIRKALLHTKMLTQLSDFTVTKSPSLNSVPLGARSSGRGADFKRMEDEVATACFLHPMSTSLR